MKTKEELNALKEKVETLNKKLAELTDEELAQVSGGSVFESPDGPGLQQVIVPDVYDAAARQQVRVRPAL